MSVIDRYDRQRRSLDLGVEGDRRLAALEVLLVGCGGVGCAVAQMLVRSGVGSLRVLDGDVVSESDLHRQCLYYPQDVEAGTPKALAALRELERIGGRPRLAAHPISFTAGNLTRLLEPTPDLVIDATDSLGVRSLLNSAAISRGIPWIYSAAIGSDYHVIPFVPAGRPCFRCYLPALPDAGTMASCESAGILPAASSSAAVTVVAQVMRWVSGRALAPAGERLFIRGNVIRGTRSRSTLLPDPACPTCGEERVILDGSSDLAPRKVCGKEQIEGWLRIPVGEAKRRLRAATEGGPGRLRETLGALRLDSPAGWVVLFPDGRVLTGPSASPEAARRRLEVILGPGCLH